MIRVIALALLLIGVSAGAKAWLVQAPGGAPPPAATVQDQQLIVLGGVNGIQLVLN